MLLTMGVKDYVTQEITDDIVKKINAYVKSGHMGEEGFVSQ